MAYSGKYKVKNPSKYRGDYSNVVYRSMWERHVMRYLDEHPNVVAWSSEEIVIPYLYEVDQRYHRYFTDFFFETKQGKKVLVEVKPDKETRPPTGSRRTKKYITEGYTFVKNSNKWDAAREYAADRGWSFEIWTEKTLHAKGIMPKSVKPLKKLKPMPKTSRKKAK